MTEQRRMCHERRIQIEDSELKDQINHKALRPTRRTILGSGSALAAGAVIGDSFCGRAFTALAQAGDAAKSAPATPLLTDRWMEIDIDWFDQKDIDGATCQFWDRFLPLYVGIHGYRGILLNVAWTVGTVMAWSGDLSQKVWLPSGTVQSQWQAQRGWIDEHGPLVGDTAERRRQWKARFAKPAAVKRRPYDSWTYGDLKKLICALKRESARHGMDDFKIGLVNTGNTDIYGYEAPWTLRHPEAFPTAARYFDPNARLHEDFALMGGLPQGIIEGITARQAYAAQWGSLSRAVGFDAIMLRDCFGLPVAYRREGPWGPVAPSPEVILNHTDGVAAFVRATKLANPDSLVMMYSNGASAVGDWRSNGLDVETIAKQGYLDIWVDQTWAGAWNEVGLRETDFWNSPTQGWTYQLGYLLVHAAILAETKVRHYPLVETFDAWEDWDVLHSTPERLRWGIWAYSHAAVKTPSGLKFPAGSYISWANQGGRLLDEQDVRFLADNINAANADAQQTTQVLGPTLVYAREAMQWQIDHAVADHDVKEWIDEQAFSVAKWPVPILSVTRVEWLQQVKSDLFILQAPSHLAAEHTACIAHLIKTGQPIALFGSPADGVDPELERIAGLIGNVLPDATPIISRKAEPAITGEKIAKNIPASFGTLSRVTRNRISGGAILIYSVEGSPTLVLNRTNGMNVILWDPPDLIRVKDHPTEVPLAQIWGNTGAPYALAAAAINLLLGSENTLHAAEIDLNQTMNVAAWRLRDDAVRILAGNLEEGLREDADMSRHATLMLPRSWGNTWKDAWTGRILGLDKGKLRIDLPQAESVLLTGSAIGDERRR